MTQGIKGNDREKERAPEVGALSESGVSPWC